MRGLGFFKSFIFIVLYSVPVLSGDAIPIKYDEFGRMFVPVEIGDGQTYSFLFDTAARRFAITEPLLPNSNIFKFEKNHISHISSSGLIRLPLAKLKNVRFGRNLQEMRLAGIFPQTDLGVGIVGFDAYDGFLVHVDPKKQQMALHANAGPFASKSWRLVTGKVNKYGNLFFNTRYRGTNLTVLLASGLSKSIINIGAVRLLFPDRVGKHNLLRGKEDGTAYVVMGLYSRTHPLKTVTLEGLNIGAWNLGDLEVAVGRLPGPQNMGSTDTALVMLGADVLGKQEYVLDYRSHQLWLPPIDTLSNLPVVAASLISDVATTDDGDRYKDGFWRNSYCVNTVLPYPARRNPFEVDVDVTFDVSVDGIPQNIHVTRFAAATEGHEHMSAFFEKTISRTMHKWNYFTYVVDGVEMPRRDIALTFKFVNPSTDVSGFSREQSCTTSVLPPPPSNELNSIDPFVNLKICRAPIIAYSARNEKKSKQVLVSFDVSKEGSVERARLASSQESNAFSNEALKVMKQWRYHPFKIAGVAQARSNLTLAFYFGALPADAKGKLCTHVPFGKHSSAIVAIKIGKVIETLY